LSRPAAVIVGCHWLENRSELAFVTRSIAGAASRCGPVVVLVPGDPGRRADGAFDLEGVGTRGALEWPAGISNETTVIVDDLTAEVTALLADVDPQAVQFVSGTGGAATNPAWQRLPLVGGHDPVEVHVPVNRLAEHHRHHGFGFTDYLLVLSDRTDSHEEPPAAAAWLSAAFPKADVVVLEDAVASAWKGRALRGKVTVDTRMDLWRLFAHANACIDLAPGPHIARECVESLRFGTPVIVPDRPGPGAAHAQSSGGATFRDASELLDAAASFQNEAHRAQASAAARLYADTHFGDPAALVRRLRDLIGQSSPAQ
jgi:hypothetical protein